MGKGREGWVGARNAKREWLTQLILLFFRATGNMQEYYKEACCRKLNHAGGVRLLPSVREYHTDTRSVGKERPGNNHRPNCGIRQWKTNNTPLKC